MVGESIMISKSVVKKTVANTVSVGHVYNMISESGLFDENYYRNVANIDTDVDAIQHYIDIGAQLGLNPNNNFDAKLYLEINSDVGSETVNPFYHYIEFGRAEGRKLKYEEQIPDFATSNILPQESSAVCHCKNEGIFCADVYRKSYSDLSQFSLEDAHSHFANFGFSEHRFRHISDVYSYYCNLYGSEFTSTLRDRELLVEFMKNKVEEEHIDKFLHYVFQPCSIEKSLYCFDIFDTLVYREVVNPEDIFSFVELKSKSWGFTKKRLDAEERCKEKFGSRQYLIQDIYDEIDFSDEVKNDLLELELNVEKENIKVRRNTLAFVNKLKSYGHDIFLISDFHLEKEELLEILPDVFKNEYADSILVSGDSGYCKHSGELYTHFFDNTDLSMYEEVCMIGDNYYSDYKNALESKFNHAIRIPTINETKLRKYISYVNSSDILIKKEIKKYSIDNGCILVPVLASSMIYLVKYIESLRLLDPKSDIFCLGRDGHLLKQCFDSLYEVTIPEVSNSRTLNFNAMINEVDDVELCLNRDGMSTTIGNLIYNRLGCNIDSKLANLPDSVIKSNDVIKNSICEKIIPFSLSQREHYKNYLSKNYNIVNGGNYIAFDIGYRGTSARAFNSMLPESKIDWIYFATFDGMIFNHSHDAIVNNIDTNKYGEVLPILEALLSNENLGSAHYFSEEGLVRKKSTDSEALKEIVNNVQQDVSNLVKQYKKENGEFLNMEFESKSNILDYLLEPDFEICAKFIGIKNEDSFANATSYFIDPELDYNKSSWKAGLNNVIINKTDG